MIVRPAHIARGIEELGLTGLPVCIHASLRSFGYIEGGADAVLDAFLAAGCTVVVPTFNYANELPPPDGLNIMRNGWDEPADVYRDAQTFEPYDPTANDMTVEDLGALPAALIERPGRIRGCHPVDSFSALGPLAEELIGGQSARDVYTPLRALGEKRGQVLLMGVNLTSMTLLHTAEEAAGRELFRRWAIGPKGDLIETLVGGCSMGFQRLEPAIGHLARETLVGESRWRAFPVQATLQAAAAAIGADAEITHCGDSRCERCRDAVLGGPRIPA